MFLKFTSGKNKIEERKIRQRPERKSQSEWYASGVTRNALTLRTSVKVTRNRDSCINLVRQRPPCGNDKTKYDVNAVKPVVEHLGNERPRESHRAGVDAAQFSRLYINIIDIKINAAELRYNIYTGSRRYRPMNISFRCPSKIISR